MLINKSFYALFSFLLLLAFNHSAFACSCMSKPTVLDSFEGSAVVAIAKIVSVEKTREKESKYDIHHIKSTKTIVEKVYKGNLNVGDELILAQGGGADCIWTFEEEWIGDRVLFYLGDPTTGHPFFGEGAQKYDKPMYHAVTCGRSTGVESATDDLSYLDNLDKLRDRTRISGRLGTWFGSGPSFANTKVKIIGKDKTYEAQTDKNGFYEIYDLPAGEYLIEPDAPKGWKIDRYMLERYALDNSRIYEAIQKASKNQAVIYLEEKRHAGMDIIFEIDNAIRGKVLSPDGKPMKGVCVTAVSTELPAGDYRGPSGCTDEKGAFEITEINPGNYVLAANNNNKVTVREPFERLLYPGTSDRKQAEVVSIEVGQFINDINIRVPKTEELIEISGKFLYSDGQPVADKWVEFNPLQKNEKIDGETRGKSDKQGRFSLKILKGVSGRVFGEMTIYQSDFEGCPHITKLIKVVGQKTWTDVETDVLEVKADENLYNIELKLPFASCQKAENNR